MSLLPKAGKLAGALPGLLIEADKVAQSVMRGVHGRRRTGSGETFWQFRPWQQGDQRRDIDWRQTAKTDGVFIRQTEWEAAQTAWLWRDASASMDFGGKKEYAELLLLSLGILLLNGGERVGLLGTGLAPQAGYPAIRRVHEALPQQAALQEGARPPAANAHLVLIGDFFFPIEELAAFCAAAARGVKGALVQVYHPDEESLPYNGHIRFEDMEQAAAPLEAPAAESLRAEYARRFAAHRESLSRLATSLGWDFFSFSTAVKPETALAALHDRLAGHA